MERFYYMRRKDREIKSKEEMEAIIRRSPVCRLGMADENGPYVVPLSFGYHDGALFFHSAKSGRKLDMIKKDNRVCFEVDAVNDIVKGDMACDWGMKFESVIGFGRAFIVEGAESRKTALDIIMAHYSQGPFQYSEKKLELTAVIKVEIESMTGKRKG
jgi:hypothetical protein